jgi:hypothetical protein
MEDGDMGITVFCVDENLTDPAAKVSRGGAGREPKPGGRAPVQAF